MKQLLKTCLSISALLSACFMAESINANVRIRSQSVDSARELVGWTDKINLFDQAGYYGAFAITPEYTQSFNGKKIARSLFGSAIATNCASTNSSSSCFPCDEDNLASFNISGSAVVNRGATDLLADYFGLPTDFQSTVTVKPKIKNFIVDFDLFVGLDELACGMWFRIHAPLVYAKWQLNLCETITDAGVLDANAGYYAPGAVARADLLPDFQSYLAGNTPTLNGGVVFQPLQNQRIPAARVSANSSDCFSECSSNCSSSSNGLHRTKLSDIQAVLGWNFWQNEDYHVGLGIRTSAPTGTRIDSRFLFAPQIGNGHHWEVGGMLTSHYTFWRNCDDTKSWGFYLDLNITHLFGTRQCRTFDLCGRGDNSKYMLAQALGLPIVNDLTGNPLPFDISAPVDGYTTPTQVFQNLFTPVANLTTTQVKVSIPVQTDLTALFNYTNTACNFSWDIGYNYWSTSCEKIKPCTNSNRLFSGNNTYALKGDAFVFGRIESPTSPSEFLNVPLSQTQSTATIFADGPIDNAQFAYGTNEEPVIVTAEAQAMTSIQPVLLDATDVNYASARTRGVSHKIFTHISRTWDEYCYSPYLGIGGKVEFTGDTNCCATVASAADCALTCQDTCVACHNGAISEWGIWLKGGISFN